MSVDRFRLYTRTPEATQRHTYYLARAGYTLDEIQTILRASAKLQRSAEIECSIDETPAQLRARDVKDANATARLESVLGASFIAQGDPRGAVVKIKAGTTAPGCALVMAPLPGMGWDSDFYPLD